MSSGATPLPSHPRSLGLRFSAGLLGLLFLLTACETIPDRPRIAYTGDPVVDGRAELQAAQPKDRVLWNYRIAAAALRRNQPDEARVQLDTAIPLIGGILANSADAKKARGLFSGEDSKTFIGEPYERVMAYYYRAILYWMEGQPDNARACYRTGQLIDSDAESNAYKSDYILLDYLDGFVSTKLAADGEDALARAQKNARGGTLPAYNPNANLIVFAEYGQGPRKYGSGEYGEQLRFITTQSRTTHARLTIGNQVVPLPTFDDLNYQATTRGGRVMDYILGRKAVFKSTTNAVGDVALTGAAIAASSMRRYDGSTNRDAANAAMVLGAIGLISKLTSAATTPKADTRTWDNLPQRLSFAAAQVAPGEYPAKVEFYDKDGMLLAARTKSFNITVKPDGDTVIFVSELSR